MGRHEKKRKQTNNIITMNYNKKRAEQDLYKCAVEHYTIEKINNKEASPHLEDGWFWRFKTRYKDTLFIEISDKDLNKDKLTLVDIIVKVRMKIDNLRDGKKS